MHLIKEVCSEGRRRILLYVDHELREPELSQFCAHLRTCGVCRSSVAQQRLFVEMIMNGVDRRPVPARLRASVERILAVASLLIFTIWILIRRAF